MTDYVDDLLQLREELEREEELGESAVTNGLEPCLRLRRRPRRRLHEDEVDDRVDARRNGDVLGV